MEIGFNHVSLNAQPDSSGSTYNFGPAHKGHSAQFRSDNITRAVFWDTLLKQMRLKP